MNTIFPPYITDIHTHRLDAGPEAIINITPSDNLTPGHHYSIGIHPWEAATATTKLRDRVSLVADNPAVLAIGEAGIDLIHSPVAPIQLQIELLRWHIDLSEQLEKPLILHVVRALEHIIQLKRQINPRQPWIWHGFRGKQQMADQLLAHGIHISINPDYPPATPVTIPPHFLHLESD